MKNLASLCLLTLASMAALGQGHVQFRNYYTNTTPQIDAPVYMYYNGQRLNGSNPLWRAALIGGPTTATPASAWTEGTLSMMYHPTTTTLTWVNFRTGTTPPAADGYVNVTAGTARVVPGVDWGGTAFVQMVAWQGNYNTWAEAWNSFQSGTPGVLIGISNPLQLTLPSSVTSPFLTYLWGLNSFGIGWPDSPHFLNLNGPADQTVSAGQPVTLTVTVDAYPTPSYQWYFNQVAIPGAVFSSYHITSAGPQDAGSYYAVLNHLLGIFTTRTATVTVRIPLTITSQPQSQTGVIGSGALFRVGAIGDAPLSYQWFFNSSAAVGTGASLQLNPLRTQDAGAYTAVVSNGSGSVTSAPAMLNVIPPVDIVPAHAVFGQADPGSSLHLEYADTLLPAMNWEPLGEVTVTTNTSPVYIDWPSSPTPRYYRAWQTNGVTTPPFLTVERVPAITLRGPVGSFVRVDCINQVGPIDAWVTLATVRLNDTSQIYFDLSAPGRPARLYRLVTLP